MAILIDGNGGTTTITLPGDDELMSTECYMLSVLPKDYEDKLVARIVSEVLKALENK